MECLHSRSCLRWGCAPCPTAPGVINHHPVGAGLQSWQSGGERSVSAPILSPAVCAVIPRCSRRGEPRLERALVQSWQNSAEKDGCICLGPTGTPPGARKRSGKNLVFPRGPAAASPTGMMVILALCQNNTPPMPEIPYRISGSLRRSEGSGPCALDRLEDTNGNQSDRRRLRQMRPVI